MSGVKQHYIPRLFLRAFRSDRKGRVAQVRVYRRDRAYSANVDDVAAERFFYSELSADGSETLDDLITRYETDLASDVRELSASAGSSVDPGVSARVVTHLLVRNRHVRGFMRAGIAGMADAIAGLFGDSGRIAALLGANGPVPSRRFRDLFDEHVVGQPQLAMLGIPAPALASLAYTLLRENAETGFDEFSTAIGDMAARVRDQGADAMRQAHVRTLGSSLAPELRVDALKALDWRVEAIPDASFILPDFVALGVDDGGTASSLLMVARESLDAVLMPLAPDLMLVGHRNGAAVPLDSFNTLAAPHCMDFFVSSVASEELEG